MFNSSFHFIEILFVETHQDIIPAVLPMFHIYGLTVVTLESLLFGSKLITLPKFTPESFINTLRRHRPHVLFVAPPLGRTNILNLNLSNSIAFSVIPNCSSGCNAGIVTKREISLKWSCPARWF